MNTITDQTTGLVSTFEAESAEELEIALQCAKKIRGHLSRLVFQESKVKYTNNLNVLDTMVSNYKSDLIQQAIAI